MLTFLGILAGGFLLSFVLTPLARDLAGRLGLVDRPDARRKMHGRTVPLAGGVALLLSVSAVLGVALLLSETVREHFAEHASQFLGLLLAALAICALGVLDDCRCLRGRHKLLGQILALGLVIAFGIEIRAIRLFGTEVELGILSVPVTLLWLLGAVNSLNLLDGMDGLLGTVGVIVTGALTVLALLGGHWAAACVGAALAGALVGFLCYNFPPASVFLGDAGSMLVGLVVGVLGIESSLKGPATLALAAPLAVLTIPFLDTLAAVVRRKLTGRSIYDTDRGHLHHCLLRRGLSARRVLLLISALCVLAASGACASLALRNEAVAVVSVLAVVCTLVLSRLFGHAELELFAKRLRRLCLSFLEAPGGNGRHMEVHLQGSAGWNGLLRAVTESAFELNLHSARLDVSAPALHEEYHGDWERFEWEEVEGGQSLWRVEIPLTHQEQTVGRLRVAGYHDDEPLVDKVAGVVRLMQDFEASLSGDETPGAPFQTPHSADKHTGKNGHVKVNAVAKRPPEAPEA
jgi:UDP-GlcNAc:undecaprenyl-phosphate GlcNAc-1-phosphate transferase